jgi:hypothetical protein
MIFFHFSIRTMLTRYSKQHWITSLPFIRIRPKFSIVSLSTLSRLLLAQANPPPLSKKQSQETHLAESPAIQFTMENQEGTQQPHLALAHKLFLLTHHDVQDIEKVRLKEEVLTAIKSDGNYLPSCDSVINYCLKSNQTRLISCFFWVDMVPLYETLVAESLLEKDQSLLDSVRAKNEDELNKLDEKWVLSLFFIFLFLSWTCLLNSFTKL